MNRTASHGTCKGRRQFLSTAAASLALPPFAASRAAKGEGTKTALFGSSERNMPSLGTPTGWINTAPLAPAALRGKVVLVQFWTYTCINWLRTHPYIRAWAKKYRDGMVVLGVHTPEFPFEADITNVERAVHDMQIEYPVAVDSDYAIWRAFGNQYWPAFYLVDAEGRIRHHQFGEGNYERLEKAIQLLIAEAGVNKPAEAPVVVSGRGLEAAADWQDLRSPETYVGIGQAQNFSSPGGAVLAKPHLYAPPARLDLNQWALSGDWTVQEGLAELNTAGGQILYRFHARDVHLVAATAASDKPIRFRVRIDGAPAGADHGGDVDGEGLGRVIEPRLYQLVRQQRAIRDRTFEIEFLDAGARAYCFTFG